MDGREYRTYDTGHIYKLGVEYGKDGVQIDDTTASTDTVWSSKKTSDEIAKKVDYKVVVEDGTRYVEDVVTQDINTWLPNDNSSILINLKKTNGTTYLNFQLLCNKKDSKNWSCIVNGAANELWKIRYVNGVRYIDEIATVDNAIENVPPTNIAFNTDYVTKNDISISRYEIRNGICYVTMDVTSVVSADAGKVVCTLPKPSSQMQFTIPPYSSQSTIRVGAILFPNGNLSFFSLEAGKRYMHTFSYPVAQ